MEPTMANTSKNNKEGSSRKRKGTKKSSGQKENQPKKMKTIKPEPTDSIGMSKQLMMKKAAQKRKRKPKPVCTNRVLPNGIMMPSLSDLEKMFEDSDEDSSKPPNTPLKPEPLPERPNSPAPYTSEECVNPEILFSPSTRRSIVSQVKEVLNKTLRNTYPADEALKSPSSRKNGFNDLPPVATSALKTEKYTTSSNDSLKYDTEIDEINSMDNLIPDNLQPNSITINSKENEKIRHVDGNLSDTSLDSNKTVEYSLSSSTPQNNSKRRAFSPLPSTSTDDKTFIKNDELFLESLKEINNNNIDIETNNNIDNEKVENNIDIEKVEENEMRDEDIQIVENDIETITIDDEAMEMPINVETETDDDVKVIDCPNFNSDNKYNYVEEDDDCVLVGTCVTKTKELAKEPEIIDLEYDFIDNDSAFNICNLDNIEDEVIDVDEIIALNQTILEKYKKPDTEKLNVSNLVVDVDMPSFIENSTAGNILQNRNSNQLVNTDATPTEDTNSGNIQSEYNNGCELVNSGNNTEHSRNRNNVTHWPSCVEINNMLDLLHANSSNNNTELSRNRTNMQHHASVESDIFNPSYANSSNNNTELSRNRTNMQHHASVESDIFNPSYANSSNNNTELSRNRTNMQHHASVESDIFNPSYANSRNNNTELSRNRTNMQHHASVESDIFNPSYANSSNNNTEHEMNPLLIGELCDSLRSDVTRGVPLSRGLSHPRPRLIGEDCGRHLFTEQDLTNFFTCYRQPYQTSIVNMANNSPPAAIGFLPRNTGRFLGLPLGGVQTTMPLPVVPQPTQGEIIQNQPTNQRLNTPKKKKTPKRKTNMVDSFPSSSPEPAGPGMLGDCPICMEKLSSKEIASTICGHVFCMSCLEQAIKTNKRCPTCRKIIKKNGYHKIFL